MLLFLVLYYIVEFVLIEAAKVRIVGGDIVSNRTAFAYQASVRYNNKHYCGGTIIDERHILTAAHCCITKGEVYEPSSITVTVGNLLLYSDSLAKSYDVKYIFTHEDYDANKITNDICLLRISGNFSNWTDEINYIDLQDTSITSGNCTVSGWGSTHYGSPFSSSRLLAVTIPIYSWSQCQLYYLDLTDKQICAYQKGKDSCQGDSGGPMVCNSKITGIVSYGANCGVYPGVYTEVYKYLDWIDEQIQRSTAITISLSSILLGCAVFSILF